MARNRNTNQYESIDRMHDDLSEEITALKTVSYKINKQLKNQQRTRTGLEGYLDVGMQGLKKTNQILEDLLGTRSFFGCNTCILFVIIIIVVIVLSIL